MSEPPADDARARVVLEELQRLPICGPMHRCDPRGLAAMARLGRVITVAEGAPLFTARQPAHELFFVVSGRVALYIERPGADARTVGSASRGDMVGWSALREGEVWNLSARATKPTRCLAFDGAELRELCERDPTFGFCLMRYVFEVVAQDLVETRMQLLDIYAPPGPA